MSQNDCLFCKIIQKSIPCALVYETAEMIAFLDISPVNKGHVLVVPRAHYDTMFDVPTTLGEAVVLAMQRVGGAIMRATGAEGLNVLQNNFSAAGQVVGHVHWHLVPRFLGDGHGTWVQGTYANQQEMEAMATSIKGQLS